MFKRDSSSNRGQRKSEKLKRNIGMRGLKSILPEASKMNEDTMFNKIKVDYLNSRDINLNYYEEKLFDDQFMMYKDLFKEQDSKSRTLRSSQNMSRKIPNVLKKARKLVRSRKRDRITGIRKPILKRNNQANERMRKVEANERSRAKTVRFTEETMYSELNVADGERMNARSEVGTFEGTTETIEPSSVRLKAHKTETSVDNFEGHSSVASRPSSRKSESVESQIGTVKDETERELVKISQRNERISSNIIDEMTEEEIFEAEMSDDGRDELKIIKEMVKNQSRNQGEAIHKTIGKRLPPVPTVKELLKPPIKNERKIPMINEKKTVVEKKFYLESLSLKDRVRRFQDHLKHLKSNMSSLIGKDPEELKRDKMEQFIKSKQEELRQIQHEQEMELRAERAKKATQKGKKGGKRTKGKFKVRRNMNRKKSAVETAAMMIETNFS